MNLEQLVFTRKGRHLVLALFASFVYIVKLMLFSSNILFDVVISKILIFKSDANVIIKYFMETIWERVEYIRSRRSFFSYWLEFDR